jgi:hypothetical protein
MLKRLVLCLISLIFALSLYSCGSKQTETEKLPVVLETEIPEPGNKQQSENTLPDPGETTEEPDISAEPVKDDFSLPAEGMRPMAVMIDNQGSKVLPQGGLDKAQIVYEVIVEGGLTRLMPVFWGTEPELIGPVRSARHYFLDFSMEYDAIYVHYGGSPQAGSDIRKLKVNEIDGIYLGTDVFWDLTNDRNNWQDTYTSMEKLKKHADKKKFRDTTDVKFPLEYNQAASDIIPVNGDNASTITLKYPSMTSRYDYDSETGTYKRFRNGKEHMERVSGKQLEARNIIVMFVRNWDIKGDPEGRQDMDTTGNGTGYFITCGKAVKLKWSKESRGSQTKYTYEDGTPIVLNRGQTWIQIMPVNAKVTIE